VELYGLDTPTGRAMTGTLLKRVKGSCTLRDAVAFCRAMVRDPHLEPRGMGFEVVAAFVGEAEPDLLEQARRWLERSCGNWALVDSLAPGKAVGWVLREAGRTDRPRLERFLETRGSRMARTTVRYAIEHSPADERRRILEATR
jgi:3-methyladenine DNA glycosylase AlkD